MEPFERARVPALSRILDVHVILSHVHVQDGPEVTA